MTNGEKIEAIRKVIPFIDFDFNGPRPSAMARIGSTRYEYSDTSVRGVVEHVYADWLPEFARMQAGPAPAIFSAEAPQPCIHCGAADATFGPDPYKYDIHEDDTPMWICDVCRHESARDI